MANVSFNLSIQGWSTISDALTNGPGGTPGVVWYDDSAQGSTTALEVGEMVLACIGIGTMRAKALRLR